MATIYEDYFSFMAWMKILMPMLIYIIMISKEIYKVENKFLMCGFILLVDLIAEVIFALIMIEATYQNEFDVVSASLRPTGFFFIAIIAMIIGIITCFSNAIWVIRGGDVNNSLEDEIFYE